MTLLDSTNELLAAASPEAVLSHAIDIGYRPHRFQAAVHAAARRFTVVVTHRRWGKTYMSCAQLVDAALRTTKQDARFAYLAPFLKQAKQSAWDYLRRFAGSIPGVSIHESELTIRFPNGARVTLYGGDNAEALRGGYFDGIVIDEVADLKTDTWGSILRPALSDRKGWAFFIGTPKGPDFFFTLYEWATSGFPVAGGGRERDPEWSDAWQPDAVFIDAGRGEGVIDRLRQLGFSVIEVNFGSKALVDAYANKRAEMWDSMAKWLRSGGCLPNHPELKTDLCTPTYSFNSANKMVLESKDDIKKRGLHSTDVADALALTFAMPVAPKSTSVYPRGRHRCDWDPMADEYRRAAQRLGFDANRWGL